MPDSSSSSATGRGGPADLFDQTVRPDAEERAAANLPSDGESAMAYAAESAVVRAIFGGNDAGRRSFMKLLGA